MTDRKPVQPRLTDDPARAEIRSSLGETLLVEAAAGTGKTTSLVERMVSLVGEGIAVDRIAAVTFTIKAAAQLDQRFQSALELAARQDPDADRRARFQKALESLDACFIGTIHAFCARLLRERPVEARLEPGFTEMDEAVDKSERIAAWARFGERLFIGENATLERLISLGIRWEDLHPTFEDLCENEDVEDVAQVEVPPPDLAAARARVETYLDTLMPELPETIPRAGWDDLQSAARQADRLRRILGRSAGETADILLPLEGIDHVVQNRWPSGRAVALLQEHEDFCGEVVAPALRSWREFLHPIALSLLRPAVESYREWRRSTGRASFQDLLTLARDLLRDHPAVREDLQRRFPRLLVDEFQDTDPIQAEVVLYLTGAETSERDCWKLSPVPGSLFVVGDPKQSIYRFRRADIETYNRFRETIRRAGGRILQLSTNFRSAGQICDWVNQAFERLLPGATQAHPEQAPHVPLQAFHAPGGPEAGAFRLEPRGAKSKQKADLVAADSTRIAEVIAGALAGRGLPGGSNRRYSPGDFLILLRRRNNMRSYAEALEQRGVPFEIAGGDAFKGEEDLAVFVTAIRAIADPDDPVSLVATLRGPLFGVDDRALYLFRKSGGRFAFDSSLPPEADPRIERAFALLEEGQRLSETLPAAAAVTRFAERLGWIASRAAGEIGDTRAGNLLKALSVIRDRSREGGSFADIVRGLDDLALAGEAEEMTSTPGQSDVTRLMTVHAAKGLEARVVFLADPTDFDPPGPRFSIERGEGSPRGHFAVWRRAGEHGRAFIALPRNWAEHEAREKSFDAAERTRLLYVAATRARETAIVSTRYDEKKKIWRGPWGALGPFLTRELSSWEAEPASQPAVLGKAALERERDLAGAKRAARRSISERPGYRAITVTTLAHDISDPASRPFASSTGKGMSWGSALHRLLEATMRDPSLDVRAYAANVLAEEDRPPGDLEEAVATVEGVRRSALWKRALASKQCLVEVPFALSVPSSDLGLPAQGPAETLLSGAIDLVFQEKDGWVLVDYKSDTVAGNLDALVRFYSPQIEHYRRVWRDLTGEPTRAGLFFLDGGREVWLPE